MDCRPINIIEKQPHFQDYLKQTQKMLKEKSDVEIRPEFLSNQGHLHFSRPEYQQKRGFFL
ncbi:hypothetical protein BKK48_06210 [Rodentibacter heidelbergensis]|uniref:Uncharacterized protein n=1 Tax=Rodentibacter heidelbergensis TaxID=1908258 RepID=A0A1V3I8L0_9PAST|nr:hypothetical protein BKK48_06210 [Rodentibacter heidelbergensis]